MQQAPESQPALLGVCPAKTLLKERDLPPGSGIFSIVNPVSGNAANIDTNNPASQFHHMFQTAPSLKDTRPAQERRVSIYQIYISYLTTPTFPKMGLDQALSTHRTINALLRERD